MTIRIFLWKTVRLEYWKKVDPVTLIDRTLEPGESTKIPKYIQIKAKDVSGVDPKYKIHLELFANGTSTENTWEEYITLTER